MILETLIPEITGVTQKQIDYATRLRKGIITKLQNVAHGEPVLYKGRKVEANPKVLQIIENELYKIKEAGYWIDNQDFYKYYARLNETANIQMIKEIIEAKKKEANAKPAKAYIAASHNDAKKIGGYGIVLIHDNKKEEIKETITEPEMLKGFNISVKMAAAIRLMNLCVKLHIKKVELHHDLPILESLTQENSEPKETMTIKYKNAYQELKQHLNINFVRIDVSTDDINFILAQELAKVAAQ